ncbi:MAG: hypothetical protein RIS70_1922 [Planctomycetota bacterium]
MRKRWLATVCGAILFGNLVGPLTQGADPAAPGSRDWPQWRGPNRDGISLQQNLAKSWPKDGPQKLWEVKDAGIGYSSVAIQGNRLYTLGDLDGVEHVIALETATGKRIWAVQPTPVARLLDDRITSEFKALDKDQDGKIGELEALSRFGWEFNRFDKSAGGDGESRLKARAKAILEQGDSNKDGTLSYEEAGRLFRDRFGAIDVADAKGDAVAIATKRVAGYLKALDKDGDQKVSRNESRGSWLEPQFNRIDKKVEGTDKGDEQLDAKELEEFLTKNDAGKDGVLSAQELEEFYIKSRVGGDGQLTKEELRGPFGGFRNDMGDGPRSTPTIDGDVLYVEGGNGDVSCLKAADGETVWHVNLRTEFGGGVPGWGYSESPLVVDNLLIVTPGGPKGTLVALDKKTGKKVWQSGTVTEGAHYSSPLIANIAGVRQVVQFASASVFGVSINDGKFLWKYAAPANGTANCCMPIVENEYVYASSSYGTGGGLTRISGGGDNLVSEEVYFDKKMQCHHGGIVKIGDYLYSNGGGALICMEFKTGKIVWQNRGPGKGSLIAADGMLYVFSEGHEVALVEATPEAYREHGRFKIEAHGRPSWAHPAIADGKLFLRDQEWLAAYDIQAK